MFNIAEQARITKLLSDALKPKELEVEDVSGGCGAFFRVHVSATTFAGKTKVAQHRMVNELLKEELKNMHGITIVTSVPRDAEQKV